MKSSTSRLGFLPLAAFLALIVTAEPAAGSNCDRIHPGALPGPPPEWTFWADGAACYVRWQKPDIPEERLSERCRRTPGARFIHFEKDRGAGSICIFKVLNSPDTAAARRDESQSRRRPEEGPESTHYRKTDAEAPVLENLQSLVTNWTERCLEREKNDARKAARCWKNGAAALAAFAGAREHVLPAQFTTHVNELQDAWDRRSAQLEATPVAAVVETEKASLPPRDEDPSQFGHDGPDPKRLAETAHCSSTRLGDMRQCLHPPQSTGAGLYAFGIKSSCSSGIIAAIKTYDASGRCIRKVIRIGSGKASSNQVRSHAEPGVLDAISFKDRAVLECYARRHDRISCDGKTDFGAKAMAISELQPQTARKKVTKVRRNYRLRYEQAEQPVEYRRKQSGVLDALSTRLKSWVDSE